MQKTPSVNRRWYVVELHGLVKTVSLHAAFYPVAFRPYILHSKFSNTIHIPSDRPIWRLFL